MTPIFCASTSIFYIARESSTVSISRLFTGSPPPGACCMGDRGGLHIGLELVLRKDGNPVLLELLELILLQMILLQLLLLLELLCLFLELSVFRELLLLLEMLLDLLEPMILLELLELLLLHRRVTKIFITHLNSDHVFGLPGLMCSLSMLAFGTVDAAAPPDEEEEAPTAGPPQLEVFRPVGLWRLLCLKRQLLCSQLGFRFTVHELRPAT
ncbi:unnamed protein product [Lampetra fluviatilis]